MEDDPQVPDWVHNLREVDSGISRTLGDGLNAEIFPGSNSMLSVVSIDPHSEGDLHSHPEEQWGVLVEGECVRVHTDGYKPVSDFDPPWGRRYSRSYSRQYQNGEEVHVEAGDFWHTPANVEHAIRTGEESALVLDIFSPPRPEYQSSGSGFAAEEG